MRHPLIALPLAAACLLLVAGCGGRATRFCGLVDTANGFDDVRATDVGCEDAFAATRAVERGDRGDWACSRSVGGVVELACRRGRERVDLLERSPVPARRHGSAVTLANLTFRLGRGVLAGRGPWCIPDVPREVLVALRLRPLTPHGGCFTRRAGRRRPRPRPRTRRLEDRPLLRLGEARGAAAGQLGGGRRRRARSSHRTTPDHPSRRCPTRPRARRVDAMKSRLLFLLLVTGLLVLALGGWTVQGLRRFGGAFAARPAFG